ncbi:MAG: TRAP transporter large permease [Brooklawnia sp.]|uniref:TRAP transporter large permease n=1 Tax=Brooklawnia sp. TaxID=2699740 RepID=UPI003C72D8A4
MIWLFLGVLFLFLAFNVPVAAAMLVAGSAVLASLGLFNTQVLAENMINGANNFALMAIPFFILTGEIMNAGGVSRRIVDFASSMVGHIRGGLGYVTVITGIIFAGISGSAVADTAALGAILIPMMAAKGYQKNKATALVAATGIIGTVIPPSIPMILFGVISGVSVTGMFMSGIVPGIIMGLSIMVLWRILTNRERMATLPKASGVERLRTLRGAALALFLPLIIIVGLRGGVFTPTEAGVVAAVYAFLISLLYRELTPRAMVAVLIQTAKTTGVVLFLAAAAMVSAYAITVAQIPAQLAQTLLGVTTNPTLMLLMIMVFLFLVGCVMDMTPAILIFGPVLLPVITSVGIDPIYFGVIMVINLSVGLITPPVGTVLYVGCGIAKISIVELSKAIWPYFALYFGLLMLLAVFPQIIMVPGALLR